MSNNKLPLETGAQGADAYTLSRRSLLRLGLTGGAMLAGMSMFGPAFSADGPTGTLTIGADADPIGLDPTTVTAFSSYDFTSLLYTGLLRWTPTMEIEPDLALSYETPNETTYIFKLREGVTFHNGQPFSAEDVKYTFDRIKDPAIGSRLAGQYSGLKAITVIDPLTVQFELETTDAAFLRFLATNPDGAIVPKGVEGLDTNPIGTGPFMFVSYEPNQQFTFKANPNYYEEGQPYLDTVIFKFYKDQSTLSSALRSRAIDMTWLKDPKVAALMAKTSPDIISAPGQTSRTFPVWLNMKVAPLNDVRVRRAISLATDREAAMQTVLGGTGKVGALLPESQIGGYDGVAEMPYYKTDPEAAKALLAEAGFPSGIDLGEYIVVAANALDVACAQILQQQWAAAGITVKITPMETAPLIKLWTTGGWPTLLSIALSWTPDPDVIFQYLVSDSKYGSGMGVGDTTYDAMVKEARSLVDPTARGAKNQEIQKYVADNAYCINVYQYPLRWELWWNRARGYVPLSANIRSYVRTTRVTD
jgi:peptide/nickel transport system substrate-binding protein